MKLELQNKARIFFLMAVMGVIYYTFQPVSAMHHHFYDAMGLGLGLSDAQRGVYGGLSGFGCLIGYLLSGPISDRFENKPCILTACAINIVLALWVSTIPSYGTLLFICCLSNCVFLPIYWGALAKFIRIQGNNNRSIEGRMTGIQYGFIGIIGALTGVVAAVLVGGEAGPVIGMQNTYRMFAGLDAVAFILMLVFYKPQISLVGKGEDAFKLKYVGQILRSPMYWLIGIAIMATYCISIGNAYVAPLLTSLGVPLAITSAVGTFRIYMVRVIFAPIGGGMIDKFGSALKVILYCCYAMIVLMAVMIGFTVGGSVGIIIPVAVLVLGSVLYQLTTPTWFATAPECGFSPAMQGTVVGLLSTLFLTPDMYGYFLSSMALEYMGDNGYYAIYGGVAVIAVIGIICAKAAMKRIAARNAAIDAAIAK